MSSAEHSHPAQAKVDRPNHSPSAPVIETVYTTVESQADRTDWLTAVSNLRQINRQLVEQIARLEQALASTKQELHDRREENQNHEITILQQQDELTVARDRVGALFQQLEHSHQIGQRQQALIETISQQLEIAQAIMPQLEAENERLSQKYRQQAQKLDKTEQVAVELHRRLKLPATATSQSTAPEPETTNPAPDLAGNEVTQIVTEPVPIEAVELATPSSTPEINISAAAISGDLTMADPSELIAGISALSPEQISFSDREMPTWTPSAAARPQKTILAPPQTSWREAIASNNAKYLDLPHLAPDSFDPKPPEMTYGEIDIDEDDDLEISKPTPKNWPSPTLDRHRHVAKTLAVDLPKFPKKPEG